MQGRGLKLKRCVFDCSLLLVAPHAGAWIETPFFHHQIISALVDPPAGACFEFFYLLNNLWHFAAG